MSISYILIFLLFIIIIRLMTFKHRLIQGGAKETKVIGPEKYFYYPNAFNKKLTLLGENHNRSRENIKGVDIVNFLKEKIKDKNTAVFLEAHQIIPKYHWLTGHSSPNLHRIRNIDSKRIIPVDIRYESKTMCDFHSLRQYGINNSKEKKEAYENAKEFIKKHKDIDSVIKAIFNITQKSKIYQKEYNLLSEENKSIIDKIIKDSLEEIPPDARIRKDYASLRDQELDKDVGFRLWSIFDNMNRRINDILTIMRVINSKYKTLYLYFGYAHIRQMRDILKEYFDITPTKTFENKDEKAFIIV